jgi:pimeloyl-ACP methyl ester carboxylesterase
VTSALERGVAAGIPWAATGSGPPLVLLAGLSQLTGVDGDGFVRSVLAPVAGLAHRRRLVVMNRRRGLPDGLTMADLAAEHAAAVGELAEARGRPVDILGASTGGSIAQQLAAEHPFAVRRLVLLSTACRLGPHGRERQARVAAQLRAGHARSAGATALGSLVPPLAAPLGRAVGWLAGRRLLADPVVASDLALTIEAEDAFDLATLPPVEAPTLVVAGANDRFYSEELFRQTAGLVPGARLVLVPGKGHLTVMQDKRAIAAISGFFGPS